MTASVIIMYERYVHLFRTIRQRAIFFNTSCTCSNLLYIAFSSPFFALVTDAFSLFVLIVIIYIANLSQPQMLEVVKS